jgi:hypothetical protein
MAIRTTYIAHIGTCITVETVDNNDSTLDLGWVDTLAVWSKRLIVNEGEVVVRSGGIPDFEVEKLWAGDIGISCIRDNLSKILLRRDIFEKESRQDNECLPDWSQHDEREKRAQRPVVDKEVVEASDD